MCKIGSLLRCAKRNIRHIGQLLMITFSVLIRVNGNDDDPAAAAGDVRTTCFQCRARNLEGDPEGLFREPGGKTPGNSNMYSCLIKHRRPVFLKVRSTSLLPCKVRKVPNISLLCYKPSACIIYPKYSTGLSKKKQLS